MKKALSLLIAVIILGVLCGGCGTASVPVSFSSLISEPEKYQGQTVTVEAIYLRGWEFVVLAESVVFKASGDTKELQPVGQTIWFTGLMPVEVQEKLYKHSITESEIQRCGKVRVTGLFETEGKYGNMNLYKYQITASEVESLEWTPPE